MSVMVVIVGTGIMDGSLLYHSVTSLMSYLNFR